MANVVKKRRRRKNCLGFVTNNKERQRRFIQRKNALFKKGYELQTLTGCEIFVLATNKDNQALYCYASPKFQTLFGKDQRKKIVNGLNFIGNKKLKNSKVSEITNYSSKALFASQLPSTKKKVPKREEKKKKKKKNIKIREGFHFHSSHMLLPNHPMFDGERLKFRETKKFEMESSLKPTLSSILKDTELFIEKKITLFEQNTTIQKPFKKRKPKNSSKSITSLQSTPKTNLTNKITKLTITNPNQKEVQITKPIKRIKQRKEEKKTQSPLLKDNPFFNHLSRSSLPRLILEATGDRIKLDELGKKEEEKFNASVKPLTITPSSIPRKSLITPKNKFWKKYGFPLSATPVHQSKNYSFDSPFIFSNKNTPSSAKFRTIGKPSPFFSPLRKGRISFSEDFPALMDENFEMTDFQAELETFSSFGDDF